MIECLKEQKKQLSQRCHQRIFRLQEVEMSDPELDYQLMRVCKQMIKVRQEVPSRNPPPKQPGSAGRLCDQTDLCSSAVLH